MHAPVKAHFVPAERMKTAEWVSEGHPPYWMLRAVWVALHTEDLKATLRSQREETEKACTSHSMDVFEDTKKTHLGWWCMVNYIYYLQIKAENKRPNPYTSIWNDHFEIWYIERFWFSDPLLNLNVLHVAAWRRAANTFLVPVIIFDQHWPVCRYITAWSITMISPFTSSVIAVDKFANMLLVYIYDAAAATITPFLAWPLLSCGGGRGNKAGIRHPAPRLIESRLSAGTRVCRPKVKAVLILALRLLLPAPHELFTRIRTWNTAGRRPDKLALLDWPTYT